MLPNISDSVHAVAALGFRSVAAVPRKADIRIAIAWESATHLMRRLVQVAQFMVNPPS